MIDSNSFIANFLESVSVKELRKSVYTNTAVLNIFRRGLLFWHTVLVGISLTV